MKDILLKRNELKRNSVQLGTVKFDENIKNKDDGYLIKQHNIVYKKYKFYDNFIKAREGVKSEKN